MAQAFDLEKLETTGEPAPVAEQVGYYSGLGLGNFSVSTNGLLVYWNTERRTSHLVEFDRKGTLVGDLGDSIPYTGPALSPDEKTLAAERVDSGTQIQNLWLLETTRKTASRFTSDPELNLNFMPVWSPDGTRVVFAAAGQGAPPNLHQKMTNGEGVAELLVKSTFNSQPTDWSRDGRFVVYASLNPKTFWDLWLLPMTGPSSDRKPVPLLVSADNEHLARFSPDGRWLAYVSDESDRNEVYVRPFSGSGAKFRISPNGGSEPRWRGDSKELFYLAPSGQLMAVTVKAGTTVEFGAPVPLFGVRVGFRGPFGYNSNYTATRDGQRFLVNTVTDDSSAAPTKIVLNWPAALRR
jgi:Tol biopolymer transport system component